MEVPDGLFKMPEYMQTLISVFSTPREVVVVPKVIEVPKVVEVPKAKVEVNELNI